MERFHPDDENVNSPLMPEPPVDQPLHPSEENVSTPLVPGSPVFQPIHPGEADRHPGAPRRFELEEVQPRRYQTGSAVLVQARDATPQGRVDIIIHGLPTDQPGVTVSDRLRQANANNVGQVNWESEVFPLVARPAGYDVGTVTVKVTDADSSASLTTELADSAWVLLTPSP